MVQITDRELAVFQMHNNCYSRNEIAKVLGISNQTVEYCLEKNKKKDWEKVIENYKDLMGWN